jgi:hypothetical protein
MKDTIIFVLLLALIVSNGFLFTKLLAVENKVAVYDSKVQYWDKAVEILEDCLEYNTFGECKQRYPQYREQFQ